MNQATPTPALPRSPALRLLAAIAAAFSLSAQAATRILVRFVIFPINATSCHFEQAFSADGGKSWELTSSPP